MKASRQNALVALVLTGLLAAAGTVAAVDLPRLSVRGKNIVNERGEAVSLRGMNFGGWLMMETWIPSLEMEWHDHLPRLAREAGVEAELRAAEKEAGGFNDDQEHIQDYIARVHQKLASKLAPEKLEAYLALFRREPPVFAAKDLDDLLRARFGDAGAQEIWDAYHDTWITEVDFQLARALGFNFIRVPFWYRWFEDDASPGTFKAYGFRYLDRAVGWAREHGLYVMLDFHGAPGCQSPWDHTGELSNARFFAEPEFQRRCAALWKAIAERYRNNATVCAYDLLNEPFSARDARNWAEAHAMIYDAIRSVDTRTIIVMEDGYKLEEPKYRRTGFFPDPKKYGWENIVYSIHFYSGWDPEFTKGDNSFDHGKVLRELTRVGKMEQQRWKVPMYIGEFSTMHDLPNDIAGMKMIMSEFNRLGWHYSPWTWKYVNDDGESSIWGVYQFNLPWERTPNVYRDSKESLLKLISRLGTENFSLHAQYGQALREVLVQPVRSAK